MLRIENLHVRYETRQGDVKALNGIDLAQDEGEVFCLVGESGAGKSTLALAIMGLLPPSASIDQGSVFYDGVDLLKAAPEYLRRLRGQTISLIFEDAQSALNPLKIGRRPDRGGNSPAQGRHAARGLRDGPGCAA